MGLLTDGDLADNLHSLRPLVQEVLDDWEASVLRDEGITLGISNLALSRICLLGESLFDGVTFPRQPGPFKRAAALCALMRMFGQFSWMPTQGRSKFTRAEEQAWVARFSLATVPVSLFMMETVLDGATVVLQKHWQPATLHLQVELLAWLRWLEAPRLSEEAVDLSRVQKTVMALAMIIEQSYYLVDAGTDCDVMHRSTDCLVDTKEHDIYWQDLTLFYPVFRE